MSPETVTLEALVDHTSDGVPHAAGTRYEAPAWAVDFTVRVGYATVVAPTPPA